MKVFEYLSFVCVVLVRTASAQGDPAIQNCVQNECCKTSNQDTSQSCWDNCGQYQGTLAEFGCHILDPATIQPDPTPPVTHAPDPTVTLLGPTNFCQGLGPGGTSCMTVSAGCYAISPLWNYIPATTCTGGAAPTPPATSCTWGCDGWNCDANSPCQSDYTCQSGYCRTAASCAWGCEGWNCDANSPCQSEYSCQSGYCRVSTATSACTWGCEGWNCDTNSPCQSDYSCQSGYCLYPTATSACTWGCEGWECSATSPCQSEFSCQTGYCREAAAACTWGCKGWECKGWECDANSPCQSEFSCQSGYCREAVAACTWGCDGWQCSATSPCQSEFSCQSGYCRDAAAAACTWGCEGWECAADSPCQSELSCQSGYCHTLGSAAPTSCTWGCKWWNCDSSSPCQSQYSCDSGYCRDPTVTPTSTSIASPISTACNWGCEGWDCSDNQPCQTPLKCSSGKCRTSGATSSSSKMVTSTVVQVSETTTEKQTSKEVTSTSTTAAAVPPGSTSPAQGAATKAKSASASVSSYQEDPTSATKAKAAQSALSDALSAAESALSQAVDSTASDALTSLESALQTALSAAAAAVAGPTAAAAASVAEAMAAVTAAATAVENIPDLPPAPPPTTRPPMSTDPSSSKASSSTSATSSTCPLCVSCADTQFWPSDASDTVLTEREDFENLNSSRISARALPTGTKKISMCGKIYSSREYNTAGRGFTKYGYIYKHNPNQCTWVFGLTVDTTTQSRLYETEHVYEAQLIKQFALFIDSKDSRSCTDAGLVKRFLTQTQPLSGMSSNPWKNSGGSALGAMMLAMSDNTRPNELIGLDKHLNGLKAAVFSEAAQEFEGGNVADSNLAKVTQMAMLWAYLSTPAISSIFIATSQRIREVLHRLDDEITLSAAKKPATSFEGAYDKWEYALLWERGNVMEREMQALVVKAKAEVMKSGSGSQKLLQEFVKGISMETSNKGEPACPKNWEDLDDVLQ